MRYGCIYITREKSTKGDEYRCTNEMQWGTDDHLLAPSDCEGCYQGLSSKGGGFGIYLPAGTLVHHDVLGDGVILNIQREYLTASFGAESKQSVFQFPQCFLEGHLLMVDSKKGERLQDYLSDERTCRRFKTWDSQKKRWESIETVEATDLKELRPIFVYKTTPKAHEQHTTKAKVYRVKTLDGKIASIVVNACIKCGELFILYSALNNYQKNHGVILYPFEPSDALRDEEYDERGEPFTALSKYSNLRLMGYSVAKSSGITRQARQELLKTILENEWMQYYEIQKHLNFLIEMGNANPLKADAIAEWEADLTFMEEYYLKRPPEGNGYLVKK